MRCLRGYLVHGLIVANECKHRMKLRSRPGYSWYRQTRRVARWCMWYDCRVVSIARNRLLFRRGAPKRGRGITGQGLRDGLAGILASRVLRDPRSGREFKRDGARY